MSVAFQGVRSKGKSESPLGIKLSKYVNVKEIISNTLSPSTKLVPAEGVGLETVNLKFNNCASLR